MKTLTQQFFLSAGETNAEQELSLPLLTSKIIDISTAHANALGIGNPVMAHKGCGWVLSRLAVEMMRYPKVNDTYSLTTWIESYNRHFSERIVEISDAEGNPLGYSRAIWMILDTSTRESVGLSHLPLDEDMVTAGKCPIARQGKHVVVVPQGYEGEMPRGVVMATEAPYNYTFKYSDLDAYRHVNTVRYVSLLLNRFSLEDFDRTQVERLELAFLRESHYGQNATLLRSDDGLTSLFTLADAQTSSPSLFASLKRRPR